MSTYQTNGIILKIADRGEADQLFSVYTAKVGKISALGKGTKKIQSKLKGKLPLFAVLNLMIAPGKNYDHIASAEIVANFFNIKNDLKKIILASFGLEVVEKLTRAGAKDSEIFILLEKFLTYLDKTKLSDVGLLKVKQKFIISLLTILGFAPKAEIASDLKKLDQFLMAHLEQELMTERFLAKIK